MNTTSMPVVRLREPRPATTALVVTLVCLAGAAWLFLLVRHVVHVQTPTNFIVVNIVAFVALSAYTWLAYSKRPHTATDEQRADLDAKSVAVVIPVYNEDPDLLRAALESLDGQTRKPDVVYVVDDGSIVPVAYGLSDWFDRDHSFRVQLWCKENGGKRRAQAVAFEADESTFIITMDSDIVLEPTAIERVLLPFADERVQSVAGMLLGANYRRSLFTRIVDFGFVLAFMTGRMAEGRVGGVTVNCGGFSAYRGEVIRDNLDRYLTQTFLGRPCTTGDDRQLTNFAMERGRTVMQETAVGYTAHPVRLSHLVRQRLRWARSWYWGMVWLLRELPLTHPAFWLTFVQVASFMLFSGMFVAILGQAAQQPSLLIGYFLFLIFLGYVRGLRYFAYARADESVLSQVGTYLLAPVAGFLNLFVLGPLYYWALITLGRVQWGTRSSVEVGLSAAELKTTS